MYINFFFLWFLCEAPTSRRPRRLPSLPMPKAGSGDGRQLVSVISKASLSACCTSEVLCIYNICCHLYQHAYSSIALPLPVTFNRGDGSGVQPDKAAGSLSRSQYDLKRYNKCLLLLILLLLWRVERVFCSRATLFLNELCSNQRDFAMKSCSLARQNRTIKLQIWWAVGLMR